MTRKKRRKRKKRKGVGNRTKCDRASPKFLDRLGKEDLLRGTKLVDVRRAMRLLLC